MPRALANVSTVTSEEAIAIGVSCRENGNANLHNILVCEVFGDPRVDQHFNSNPLQ